MQIESRFKSFDFRCRVCWCFLSRLLVDCDRSAAGRERRDRGAVKVPMKMTETIQKKLRRGRRKDSEGFDQVEVK